jgi:hypothetical protein
MKVVGMGSQCASSVSAGYREPCYYFVDVVW